MPQTETPAAFPCSRKLRSTEQCGVPSFVIKFEETASKHNEIVVYDVPLLYLKTTFLQQEIAVDRAVQYRVLWSKLRKNPLKTVQNRIPIRLFIHRCPSNVPTAILEQKVTGGQSSRCMDLRSFAIKVEKKTVSQKNLSTENTASLLLRKLCVLMEVANFVTS